MMNTNPHSKGLNFARYVASIVVSKGDFARAAALAENKWRGAPIIGEAIRKAAVAIGDSTTSGWASELTRFGIAEDFLQAVRNATVLDRLTAVRRVPFQTKIPVETAGVNGAWVQEGRPIPVSKGTFDQLSLPSYSGGAIVALSDDLLELLTPTAIATIRDTLVRGVVQFYDEQFLDPSVALVADVSPASITNGATQVSNTGNTAAAMTADFANMIDAADDLINPVWIMRAKICAKIAGTLTFPGVKIDGGELLGIPIITSKSQAGPVGSPAIAHQITLIDQDAVVLADEGDIDAQFSRVASIQMSDAPSGAAQHVSMFQTISSAARVLRRIAWLRTRSAGAVFMEADY